MLKLFILITSLLLFSCAKEVQKSKTTIKFTQGAVITATQTGGVLVFGRRLDGPGMFSLPLVNELDPEQIDIPYGMWDIGAVSWNGGNKLEGTVRCGKVNNIPINKEQMIVPLTLNVAGCADALFGPAVSKETVSPYANQPIKLGILSCLEKEALMEDPTGISHCTTGGNFNKGAGASFQFAYKKFNAGLGIAPSGKLLSACQTSAGATGSIASEIRVPIFDKIVPLPFEIKIFAKNNCTGPAEVYHFDYGIHNELIDKARFFMEPFTPKPVFITKSRVCDFFDPALAFATGAFNSSGKNIICNENHFNSIASNITAVGEASEFTLLRDLDHSVIGLNKVGDNSNAFKGKFFGNNRVIKNYTLTPTCDDTTMNGLFNNLTNTASIYDLKIDNMNITSGSPASCKYVAPISYIDMVTVGKSAKLHNIKVTNSNFVGGDYVAGLVGKVTGNNSNDWDLNFKDIRVLDTDIEGAKYVGGIVGNVNATTGSAFSAGKRSARLVAPKFVGSIIGDEYVGGIAGSLTHGTIIDGWVETSLSATNLITADGANLKYIGGAVGQAYGSHIVKTNIDGDIKPSVSDQSETILYIGGVIGADHISAYDDIGKVEISHSSYKGDIKAKGKYFGGIAGRIKQMSSKIHGSHSAGSITSYAEDGTTGTNIGGIAGANSGEIIACASYMYLEGSELIGGIAGENIQYKDKYTGLIERSYYKGAIEGNNKLGGIAGESSGIIQSVQANAELGTLGSGSEYVGGLVGRMVHGAGCTVFETFSNNRDSGGSGCFKPTLMKGISKVQNTTGLTLATGSFRASVGDISALSPGITGIISNVAFVDPNGLFSTNEHFILLVVEFDPSTFSCTGTAIANFTTGFVCEDTNTPKRLNLLEYELTDYFAGAAGLPLTYEVNSELKLRSFKDNPLTMGAHIKLTSNINLTSSFASSRIGSLTNPFVGYFEPNGYTISNLEIDVPDGANVGLFSVVGDNEVPGVVGTPGDPLKIVNATIAGGQRIGTVVGHLKHGEVAADVTNATIDTSEVAGVTNNDMGGIAGRVGTAVAHGLVHDSKFEGDLTAEDFSGVGGIVGYLENGDVKNSKVYVDINDGMQDVGGLVGVVEGLDPNAPAKIYDSHAFKKSGSTYMISGITGLSSYGAIGGLVGALSPSSTKGLEIVRSSNHGEIYTPDTHAQMVGGIIGLMNKDVIIEDSFVNTTLIQGNDVVGGLIGKNNSTGDYASNIINSYVANATISSTNWVAGISGITTGSDNTSISNSFAYNLTISTSGSNAYAIVSGDSDMTLSHFYYHNTSSQSITDVTNRNVYSSTTTGFDLNVNQDLANTLNNNSSNFKPFKSDSRGYPKLYFEP